METPTSHSGSSTEQIEDYKGNRRSKAITQIVKLQPPTADSIIFSGDYGTYIQDIACVRLQNKRS